MKIEQTVCSETSAYKIQTPGNYTEESVQHSEQGESLKSRNYNLGDDVEFCIFLTKFNIIIIIIIIIIMTETMIS